MKILIWKIFFIWLYLVFIFTWVIEFIEEKKTKKIISEFKNLWWIEHSLVIRVFNLIEASKRNYCAHKLDELTKINSDDRAKLLREIVDNNRKILKVINKYKY